MRFDIFGDDKETEKKCVEWCVNVAECRTVDYGSSYTVCHLHNKTALDVPCEGLEYSVYWLQSIPEDVRVRVRAHLWPISPLH